jgi:hypothetical protein
MKLPWRELVQSGVPSVGETLVTHAPESALAVDERREFRPDFDTEGWPEWSTAVVLKTTILKTHRSGRPKQPVAKLVPHGPPTIFVILIF